MTLPSVPPSWSIADKVLSFLCALVFTADLVWFATVTPVGLQLFGVVLAILLFGFATFLLALTLLPSPERRMQIWNYAMETLSRWPVSHRRWAMFAYFLITAPGFLSAVLGWALSHGLDVHLFILLGAAGAVTSGLLFSAYLLLQAE